MFGEMHGAAMWKLGAFFNFAFRDKLEPQLIFWKVSNYCAQHSPLIISWAFAQWQQMFIPDSRHPCYTPLSIQAGNMAGGAWNVLGWLTGGGGLFKGCMRSGTYVRGMSYLLHLQSSAVCYLEAPPTRLDTTISVAKSEFQTDGAEHRKERFAKSVRANGWMSSGVAVEHIMSVRWRGGWCVGWGTVVQRCSESCMSAQLILGLPLSKWWTYIAMQWCENSWHLLRTPFLLEFVVYVHCRLTSRAQTAMNWRTMFTFGSAARVHRFDDSGSPSQLSTQPSVRVRVGRNPSGCNP